MTNKLSQRELQILRLVSLEHSTVDIAEKLLISSETVTTHGKNLMRKLDASNTAGMIRRGFEVGFLIAGNRI